MTENPSRTLALVKVTRHFFSALNLLIFFTFCRRRGLSFTLGGGGGEGGKFLILKAVALALVQCRVLNISKVNAAISDVRANVQREFLCSPWNGRELSLFSL